MIERLSLAAALTTGLCAGAPGPEQVLVIVNRASPAAVEIARYYTAKRAIPAKNVCTVEVQIDDDLPRPHLESKIEAPVTECLKRGGLVESVLYLVSVGLPLRVIGKGGQGGDLASIDSELTLLYSKIQGKTYASNGWIANPFFRQKDAPFAHPRFPIYLVTRLDTYDKATSKKLVDRCLAAANRGQFVIDLRSDDDQTGNDWLRNAAILLPKDRVLFDSSPRVITGARQVIAYASWGSNDLNRKQRMLNFEWLPGAIVSEFVSSNGRTLQRPPATWALGNWNDQKTWFAGSPQSLAADYLDEGASGASGHVAEPFLSTTPRPELLLPAYYYGRNLAESYWLSIPVLSWMNIVIGDPLCAIGPPPGAK